MGLKTEGEKLCFQGGLLSATVHVALHTADPTAANELSGNNYARVAVLAADWTIDAGNGRASNTNDIRFPTRTATWGKPTHVGLWDAATGGDLLLSLALDEAVPAPSPSIDVTFDAGKLIFNLKTN